MFRTFLGAVLGASASLAVIGVELPARAQTITLPAKLDRTKSVRRGTQYPYWVSYSDCVQENDLQFTNVAFSGAGFNGAQLQVWVGQTGSACDSTSDVTARTGSAPTCWLVYSTVISNYQTTVVIRAQDVAGQHKAHVDLNTGPGSGTLADCTKPQSTPIGLQFYFMFMSGELPISGSGEAIWKQTTLDIWGPDPPIDVSATPGETRIHLSWNSTQAAQDVVGYQFYCDPPRGGLLDGGAIATASVPTGTVRQLLEAGAGGTTSWFPDGAVASGGAGTGGTTSTQTDCNAGSAVAGGKIPDPAYYCGSQAGKYAHDGVADGLTNGVQYAVAVAGVDQVGNVGKLSANQCATPVNVTDFFELYRLMGGQGGGGFCSFSPLRRSPVIPLAAAAAAFGFAALRRRRRR